MAGYMADKEYMMCPRSTVRAKQTATAAQNRNYSKWQQKHEENRCEQQPKHSSGWDARPALESRLQHGKKAQRQ